MKISFVVEVEISDLPEHELKPLVRDLREDISSMLHPDGIITAVRVVPVEDSEHLSIAKHHYLYL